jgi:hypothetical protein
MAKWENGFDQPTYTVLPATDAQSVQIERPAAIELFRLGLLSGAAFFLAALLISLAGGSAMRDAFRLALKVGGISLGILWPLLIFFYLSDDLGRTLNAFLAAWLRRREIEAMRELRLREIEMQETVSLARAALEEDRAQVARQALIIGSANLLPSGNTPFDPVEKALTEKECGPGVSPQGDANPPSVSYADSQGVAPSRAIGRHGARRLRHVAPPQAGLTHSRGDSI